MGMSAYGDVIGAVVPVNPRKPEAGSKYKVPEGVNTGETKEVEVKEGSELKQPRYFRKGTALQTSDALNWHQNCVAKGMTGASGSRKEIREKFEEVSQACEKKNPHTGE